MTELTFKEYIINLELNKFIYFPEDIIEGIINLKANDSLINKIISDDIIIYFSLKQNINYYCEEYDYTYETITHFNERKSYVVHEVTNNYDYLKGYSINYGLKIPFKFQIPKIENGNKLCPSFRFIETNFQCYVNHLLNIEIKNKSNKCSMDIFIRKPKLFNGNNSVKIFKDEMIKKYFFINKGKLSYYIETINCCNYYNSLPITIHLDKTDLINIKIKLIELSINKIISFKDIKFLYNKKIQSKKIKISDDVENKQIKESIKINKNEFPEITKEIIEKQIYGDIDNNSLKEIQKKNYSPPLDNIFFKCYYILKIEFIFEDKFIKNRIIEIPIDYYDEEYNNNYIKVKMEENISELESEKIIENKNINNSNKLDLKGEFTLLTKEDFIELIDGKKNKK